jgi:hypothetical protein
MSDEKEFFGPYGVSSLSRYYQENPFVFSAGEEYKVQYLPAEWVPECSDRAITGYVHADFGLACLTNDERRTGRTDHGSNMADH